MKRRLWLSIAMLAVGASLLAAASLASAAAPSSRQPTTAGKALKGGTFHASKSVEVDFVDPALAYFAEEWYFENQTIARLLQYPDLGGPRGYKLVPEVATGLPKVSKDGKTYTFTVRKGFKYNTGKPVTADDFAWAMDRMASGKEQSATYSYHRDIVGFDAVNNDKAKHLSGVKVSANKITIHLTKPAPDFPARTTMPFFGPLPRSVPIDPNGVVPPGSGPYYFSKADVNRQIVLSKNPHYGGHRVRNIDKIVFDLNSGSLANCKLQVDKGQVDWCSDGIPPAAYGELAKKYGVNKKRFFAFPGVFVRYIAMNTSRPIFKDIKKRKAIEYALNRPALVAQSGYLAGIAWDRIMPPPIAGKKLPAIYPRKLNAAAIAKAKSLAGGGGDLVMYNGNAAPRPARSQVVQASLKGIGFNVSIKLFSRPTQKTLEGRRGEPFDLTDEGWAADFLDPKSYFDPLLNGNTIAETENVNVAYFNVSKYNREIERAGTLAGSKRFNAYRALENGILKTQAPWAVYQDANDTYYFSSHVGCLTYHPVFGILFNKLCLK